MLYLFLWFLSLYLFIFFKFYEQPAFPKKQVVFFKNVFFTFFVYFFSLIFSGFIFEIVFTRKNASFWLFEIFLSSLFSFFCLFGYCLTLNKNLLRRIFFFDKHFSMKKIPVIFFQSVFILILFYPFLQITTAFITSILERVFSVKNLFVEQTLVSRFKESYMNLKFESLFLFTVTIIVPCIEEFLFRGVMQSFLREKLSRKSGIFISSFFFSLAHFSILQGIGNIVLLINLFIFSLCIGWFYERVQSLIAPIFLHMLFNGYNSYLIILSR